jgi:hypothetical protein
MGYTGDWAVGPALLGDVAMPATGLGVFSPGRSANRHTETPPDERLLQRLALKADRSAARRYGV